MAESLNWKSVVVGVLATVASGLLLARLQDKQPGLTYVAYQTRPFQQASGQLGIYSVLLTSTGKLPAKDVTIRVAVDGASISAARILADPGIARRDSLGSDVLVVRATALNPGDEIRVSLLATAPASLPSRATVSARGEGVVGVGTVDLSEERHDGGTFALVAFLSAVGGGAIVAFTGRRGKSTGTPAPVTATVLAQPVSAAHLSQPFVIRRGPEPREAATTSEHKGSVQSGDLGEAISTAIAVGSDLFAPNSPIPRGFEGAPPGTRLSLVPAMYPGSKQSAGSSYISVYPVAGPFKDVTFFHDTDEHDPPVRRLVCFFRDSTARELVRAEALRVFGADSVVSKVLGRELEWSNVAGYRVRIKDDLYEVARAS